MFAQHSCLQTAMAIATKAVSACNIPWLLLRQLMLQQQPQQGSTAAIYHALGFSFMFFSFAALLLSPEQLLQMQAAAQRTHAHSHAGSWLYPTPAS